MQKADVPSARLAHLEVGFFCNKSSAIAFVLLPVLAGPAEQ